MSPARYLIPAWGVDSESDAVPGTPAEPARGAPAPAEGHDEQKDRGRSAPRRVQPRSPEDIVLSRFVEML